MTDKSKLEQVEELMALSKVNVSFTGNSKGINTHVSVYEGVTEKAIDEAISMASYAFRGMNVEAAKIQKQLGLRTGNE